MLNFTGLKQLKTLNLDWTLETAEELRLVGAMPQLEQVTLLYHDGPTAVAAAPGWQQLKQLQDIIDAKRAKTDEARSKQSSLIVRELTPCGVSPLLTTNVYFPSR